jgi:alanine racemase
MKVSKVSKGDVIGYGATKINENGYVAIIPLGYGDGIPLSISGFSWDFEGVHVKAIGRVNMDMCFLFLPEHIDPKKWENKKINLWGDDQQILSKLAAHCGVHPYYIFCTITGRIPREYHLE